MEQQIEHMVGVVVEHLGGAVSSGAVSGEPIKVGDVTMVVLSMISIGMGAGGGEGEGDATEQAKSSGGGGGEGAGGGAKVRPAAVIAFTPSGVEVLPIPDEPGMIDKVVDRIPDVMELVDQARHTFGEA